MKKSELKKLIKEIIKEDNYFGDYRQKSTKPEKLTSEHVSMITSDINEFLGTGNEVDIVGIYETDGEWWIDGVGYDHKANKPKHIYLTAKPNRYQENLSNIEYASHGYPIRAVTVYEEENI